MPVYHRSGIEAGTSSDQPKPDGHAAPLVGDVSVAPAAGTTHTRYVPTGRAVNEYAPEALVVVVVVTGPERVSVHPDKPGAPGTMPLPFTSLKTVPWICATPTEGGGGGGGGEGGWLEQLSPLSWPLCLRQLSASRRRSSSER